MLIKVLEHLIGDVMLTGYVRGESISFPATVIPEFMLEHVSLEKTANVLLIKSSAVLPRRIGGGCSDMVLLEEAEDMDQFISQVFRGIIYYSHEYSEQTRITNRDIPPNRLAVDLMQRILKPMMLSIETGNEFRENILTYQLKRYLAYPYQQHSSRLLESIRSHDASALRRELSFIDAIAREDYELATRIRDNDL